MKTLLKHAFAFFCLLAFSGCLTPLSRLPDNAILPTIAVSSFENRSGFAGQWQLGSGMSDLLVSELVGSRCFVVVEREHLAGVVNEIDRQKDKRFRDEGRVDEGRLKNVRYLIRGVINDFSQESSISLWVALRHLFLNWRGHKARVALTLTIVDVESGEIIDSVQCAGTARASEAYGKAAYKDISFGGDAFFRTPLGQATAEAIRYGVNGIIGKMPRVFWEPMIAAVVGDKEIVVNGGIDRKIKEGAVYNVRGAGQAVTDPVTGDILSVIPGRVVAIIRITRVEDKIAHAEAIDGSGLERGQRLILKKADRGGE